MDDTIIIIGAGVAGLAAGCYAQMNGYRTKIFEMHNLPGGLCTAWERKDYIFDGCIHYLFGSGEGQPFYEMWAELGAVQGREFVHHDEFIRITAIEKGENARTLIVYADPDRLEEHMNALSPADSPLIRAFCAGIRAFTKFDLSLMYQKPKARMGLRDWAGLGLKMSPFIGPLARWGMLPAETLGQRFKDPFLRRAVPQMFAWSSIPTMVGMSLLAYMHTRNAGFPVGASLEFARALEKRYLELGGEIHYNAQVERILIKDQRAVGVRLYDNRDDYAGRVISACDGHATLFDMLGSEYLTPGLRKMYSGRLPVHSQLQVSLGVNLNFNAEPHWVTYLLEHPVVIAGEDRYEIGVKHYGFDPSLAPPGKSVIEIMLTTSYDYWQRIYGRRIYNAEQIQESGVLIDWLASRYPGLKDSIEYCDVATPLSYERYTGNWQGSSCGWLLSRETMPMMLLGVPKTLPRLKNFYMAGQWVEPGGSVPVSAASGRCVVMQICAEDGRRFHAGKPG